MEFNKEIYKRNGIKVIFDRNKIINSVKAAYESVGETFNEDTKEHLLYCFNNRNINKWCIEGLGVLIPSVEDIQNKVENVLIGLNYNKSIQLSNKLRSVNKGSSGFCPEEKNKYSSFPKSSGSGRPICLCLP